MTQDEIIEMAEQAGMFYMDFIRVDSIKQIEALIKLAAAKEREACARLCETGVDTEHPTVKGHIMKDFGASTHLANAIRARGEQA